MLKRLVIGIALGVLLASTCATAGSAKIYVGNFDDNIYVHDLSTGMEEAVIEIADHNNPSPYGLFITPPGDELFIITAAGWAMDQEFIVYDTVQNTEKRRGIISRTSARERKLRFGEYSPDGGKIYFLPQRVVRSGFTPFQVFDTNLMIMTDQTDLSFDGRSMLTSPDGSRLYLKGRLWNSVDIITKVLDADTLEVIVETDVINGSLGAMSPAGDYMVVYYREQLKFVDTETLQVLPGSEVTVNGWIKSVSIDDNHMVVMRGIASVDIYDLEDLSLLFSIDLTSLGWYTTLVADYDEKSGKLSVGGFSMSPSVSGRVATIDVATGNIEYDVVSGYIPSNIVIKPSADGLSLLVKRLVADSVQCTNNTTGQVVYISPAAGEQGWDCESHGLLVAPGDSVSMTASGTVD